MLSEHMREYFYLKVELLGMYILNFNSSVKLSSEVADYFIPPLVAQECAHFFTP